MIAGKLHAQAFVSLREVGTAQLQALHELPARRLELGRHGGHVRCRHRHARERRRFEREGLCLRGSLERHLTRRHRPLLDPVDRLPRHAVEQEQQSRLVDHRDGRNGLASLLHVDQGRRRCQVGIPDVVMHHLEVPQVFAGVRIRGNDAGAEEVVAGAVAAVLVNRWRAEWHVDDAALVVDGKNPQTFTPERFFQLSPAHVSLNFSPARGTERKVHTSLPVRMSHARTSPAGPCGGFSCVVPPVMTRFLYMIGGELKRVAARQAPHDLGRIQVDDAVVAEVSLGIPVLASSE